MMYSHIEFECKTLQLIDVKAVPIRFGSNLDIAFDSGHKDLPSDGRAVADCRPDSAQTANLRYGKGFVSQRFMCISARKCSMPIVPHNEQEAYNERYTECGNLIFSENHHINLIIMCLLDACVLHYYY